MACDVLDFRCIFVNELVGNILMAIFLGMILYLIVANKMKFGFDTTLVGFVAVMLIIALAFGNFAVIFAFTTLIAAIVFNFFFQKVIQNR